MLKFKLKIFFFNTNSIFYGLIYRKNFFLVPSREIFFSKKKNQDQNPILIFYYNLFFKLYNYIYKQSHLYYMDFSINMFYII
jgi:hypothetical protein